MGRLYKELQDATDKRLFSSTSEAMKHLVSNSKYVYYSVKEFLEYHDRCAIFCECSII